MRTWPLPTRIIHKNLEKYGHMVRVVVVDDSTSEQVFQQNLDIVHDFARNSSLSVQYYGKLERDVYSTEFVKVPDCRHAMRTIDWVA